MKPLSLLFLTTAFVLAPAGVPQVGAQHHHHHYRHHHHQTYDPVLADVQSALTRAGLYHTRVDGIYGSESAHAIRAFQRSKGLAETGVIDGNVLSALGLNVPAGQQNAATGGPQVAPASQGAAAQHSSATGQEQQRATTPQQSNVPAGYQLVPIAPHGSTAAPASKEPTPIPNP